MNTLFQTMYKQIIENSADSVLFEKINWGDLILDTQTNEIAIQEGDFAISTDSKNQAAQLLIELVPGSLKEHPAKGIGIQKHSNAPASHLELTKLKTNIKKALEQDGHRDFNITLGQNNNNIEITITT